MKQAGLLRHGQTKQNLNLNSLNGVPTTVFIIKYLPQMKIMHYMIGGPFFLWILPSVAFLLYVATLTVKL